MRASALTLLESLLTLSHPPSPREIERRDASTLSVEDFYESYKRNAIPVIITNATDNWDIMNWGFDRIKSECVDDHVSFAQKGLHLLQSLPPDARRQWNAESERVFGVGLEEMAARINKDMSVAEFVEYVDRSRPDSVKQKQTWDHLVHYALPLNMHSFPLHKFCSGKLVGDLTLPKYMLSQRVEDFCMNSYNGPVVGGVYDAEVFFAGEHSRAYPSHLHGVSAEILLVVVRGKKQFVGWDYAEKEHLYPFKAGFGTETGDEIFLAEGINPNFELQPDLRGASGWQGRVEQGEILYIPCGLVHQVQNLEPTFSLTLRSVDSVVTQCSARLRDMGARPLEIEYLELLDERLTSPDFSGATDMSWSGLHDAWCPDLAPFAEVASEFVQFGQ